MKFNEDDLLVRHIAIHYSRKLKNQLTENIVLGNSDIASSDEARRLTQFFWDMASQAAKDYQNDGQPDIDVDLEDCMEKLMNIFIGYTKRASFNQQWVEESNKINGI